MKVLFLATFLLFGLSAQAADAVDLAKPMPALALPDGRILKNATITKFNVADVVVRHSAGISVLRYEFLPDDVRLEAEKKRPGGPRTTGSRVAAATAETISGQVFITTRGAGAYKFSGVTVYALPLAAIDNWKHSNILVELPFPISKTTTDADGKFRIQVPKGTPFFLFGQANRQVGDQIEQYEWRAPSSEFEEKDNVQLSSKWRFPLSRVKIAESP